MSLYETGTITGALNSTTISGTGTKWSDAKIGITNGSVLFVSSSAGMDGVYQVKRVINDTSIELAQPIYKAFTHSKYSILVAEASSTASFANQLAAALGYYQAQIDGWQQIMTGTGDIVLTAPDGTKVTIKSFTKMSQDIDKKQDKSKILTDISNSKDADGVREYLGLNEKVGRRFYTIEKPNGAVLGKLYPVILNNLRLKSRLSVTTSSSGGSSPMNNCEFNGDIIAGGWSDRGKMVSGIFWSYDTNERAIHSIFGGSEWNEFCAIYIDGGAFPIYLAVDEGVDVIATTSNYTIKTTTFLWGTNTPETGTKVAQLANFSSGTGLYQFGGRILEGNSWVYSPNNTTKTSDGTLKVASPIINIFHDGKFEVNAESEGACVTREERGIYRVTNVLGMNSDGAWGGIDGGFDVPKDRNGQHLVWLDYEVDADGSILVKTYHRTYPDSPEFARNFKEGYDEGDPIDIPSDQFLSVRVEMPQDSIFNRLDIERTAVK